MATIEEILGYTTEALIAMDNEQLKLLLVDSISIENKHHQFAELGGKLNKHDKPEEELKDISPKKSKKKKECKNIMAELQKMARELEEMDENIL